MAETNEISNNLTTDEILNKIYSDPKFPSAYSSDLKRFLLQKESLSRHKKRIKKFKRRKTFVGGPYTLIQSDTIFYRNFARANRGYKYILVVIDAFSRKNWVRPMKSLQAEETARNLDSIIGSMPFKVIFIICKLNLKYIFSLRNLPLTRVMNITVNIRQSWIY